ncbi:MAG: GYF domain-containing protein, partial [Pseudoxanthomonas sp.]
MSEWYYSAGNDRRLGPFSSADLVAEFRQGRIGLDTLVWREGQSQWQALADFSSELGLTGATGTILPPPLPSRSAAAPQAVAAAPRTGLSGCMIALIVVAALAVPLLAILAAIAVPAYQQYLVRTKVASALPIAYSHKLALSSHLARAQACPDNEDAEFRAPETYAQGSVAAITFGKFESDLCGMEVILAVPGN